MPLSKSRGLQRFFFSGATDVETDKQGRILIPQPLRDHAGLTKDVTFVGVSSRVEIWDTSRWNQVNGELTEEALPRPWTSWEFSVVRKARRLESQQWKNAFRRLPERQSANA